MESTHLPLITRGKQRYSPDILGLLIEKGANISARDDEGKTPLHFAYQHGVKKMVDFLLEKGAKRDAKTKHGITPEMLHSLSAYSKLWNLLSR
jgi:ankyrin repeat protein